MIVQFAEDACDKRDSVIISFLIGQIDHFFRILLSANTMSHVIRSMPHVKTVMGPPMDKSRVFTDPTAIENYSAAVSALIDGVTGDFISSMDETGFADLQTLETRCWWFRQHISTTRSHVLHACLPESHSAAMPARRNAPITLSEHVAFKYPSTILIIFWNCGVKLA
jgi:hypothetical protein